MRRKKPNNKEEIDGNGIIIGKQLLSQEEKRERNRLKVQKFRENRKNNY